jgi:site-specific recombinase XerC
VAPQSASIRVRGKGRRERALPAATVTAPNAKGRHGKSG